MEWVFLAILGALFALVGLGAVRVYDFTRFRNGVLGLERLALRSQAYLRDFGRRQTYELVSPREIGSLMHLPPIDVVADRSGYLRSISWRKLRGALVAGPWVAEVRVRPGQWVEAGTLMMQLKRKEAVDRYLIDQLRGIFPFTKNRHSTRDPLWPVEELLNMATEDVSTAEVINAYCDILMEALEAPTGTVHALVNGGGFVKVRFVSFEELLNASLSQLLSKAQAYPMIQSEILEVLEDLREVAAFKGNKDALVAIDSFSKQAQEIAA